MNKPRGKPFQPGNTFGRGRPKGSKNKATQEMQQLLAEYGPLLIRKCIQLALQGNMNAMRLCLERGLAPLRDANVTFPLPPIKTIADLEAAHQSTLQSVVDGDLPPAQGEVVTRMLKSQLAAMVTAQLEQRIERLEQEQKQQEPNT